MHLCAQSQKILLISFKLIKLRERVGDHGLFQLFSTLTRLEVFHQLLPVTTIKKRSDFIANQSIVISQNGF